MQSPARAAAALLACVACGCAHADNQLVGTWRLVSASAQVDGEPRNDKPYGENPAGLLMYTRDGRVIVLISHDGRRPLSVEDQAGAPTEERAEAFATHFSYSGTYRLSGNRVVHKVEIASVPNWVGDEFVREVRQEDNRLVLTTPPILQRGRQRTFSLTWERIK